MVKELFDCVDHLYDLLAKFPLLRRFDLGKNLRSINSLNWGVTMPNRTTIRLVVVTCLLFTNAPAEDRIHSINCSSEAIVPDSSDNTWLQPLIHLDSSELEPFQWNHQANAILIDYAKKQEQLAQYFIDCGDWECLVKQCRSTKAAQDALEKLDKAGLKVLSDGRIISKNVFVSIVPITR